MRKIVLLITILICHWGYSQEVPENVEYSEISVGLETGHISSRSTLSTPISSEFYHPKISIGNKFSVDFGLFFIAKKFHHTDSLFQSDRTRTIGVNYTFYTSSQKFFVNSGVVCHIRQQQFTSTNTIYEPFYQAISTTVQMGYHFNQRNTIFLGAALRNNRTILYNQAMLYAGLNFKFRKEEKDKEATEE